MNRLDLQALAVALCVGISLAAACGDTVGYAWQLALYRGEPKPLGNTSGAANRPLRAGGYVRLMEKARASDLSVEVMAIDGKSPALMPGGDVRHVVPVRVTDLIPISKFGRPATWPFRQLDAECGGDCTLGILFKFDGSAFVGVANDTERVDWHRAAVLVFERHFVVMPIDGATYFSFGELSEDGKKIVSFNGETKGFEFKYNQPGD